MKNYKTSLTLARAAATLVHNTRRTAAVLALMMLTATTAWATENTTFPLTSGQTWTNTTTNTTYTVSGEAGNWTLTVSVADASVNDGKGTIADQAFYDKDLGDVKTIAIDAGITRIGEKAFSTWPRGYTTVTFAENSQLATIAKNAFYAYTILTSINLGDCLMLESIGDAAFCGCTGLTTLDLSGCTLLTTIGSMAFYDCTNLTITIPKGLSIGSNAFDNVKQVNQVGITLDGLTYNETDGCFDIGSLTELQALMTYANAVGNTTQCKNLTFRLTADIDMTGQTYTPIPNFAGTFNGNSKTITGLEGSNGLFASIIIGGSVTGLTLSGVSISGGGQVGAIAGNCVGVIENCHVTGSVSGSSDVGGIVGVLHQNDVTATNNPHISGCTFSGTVTGTSTHIGGIVGRTCRPVQNCTTSGSAITGVGSVGGIVGAIIATLEQAANYDISNCTVAGVSVSGQKGYTSKICGYIDEYITTDHATIVHDNTIYYSVEAGVGVTVTYQSGDKTTIGGVDYYKEGATFTLGNNNSGGIFLGYTSDDVTITNGSFTMPAADVTVSANWADPNDFSVNDAGTEYTIHTAEGWGVFCDLLAEANGKTFFSGKTVKLGDNITVTRMAGSDNHDFCGTFDGGGNTITLDLDNSKGGYALFRNAVSATIRNLHVDGTIITTGKYAAGLISGMWGTVSIENCRSSVTIKSAVGGDGTHGGFVAVVNDGSLNIEGCVFDGKLLTTNGSAYCGGFVGRNAATTTITNCLYAPAELEEDETWAGASGSATFVRGGATVTNSYYTSDFNDGTSYTAQGKALHKVKAGDNVTIEAVALTGTATQYGVSGITAYSVGGLQCGETLYYGSGDEVSLTLSNTATGAPLGYQYGYTASAGTLDGTTLTMPDEDVTITAALAPIDWATVNQGNSADPYMIYNKDQLLLLAHRVNGTNDESANDYEGKYFKLGADITFTHPDNETDDYAENYEAIGGDIGGTTIRYFNGKFDGDNHTVSGIRIRKDGTEFDNIDQGLFGRIGSGANIHDVHLTDARITGDQNVGGIAGYNNKGYIMRCSVTDSYITATDNWNYGTICGLATSNYSLTNNYYHGCTVNGTKNATNVGCGGSEIADLPAYNGALPAYAITLGDGVSTTALASAPENGFVYNDVSYYREGLALPLASTLGSEAPEGYTLSFSANGTALSGNTYTVNTTDGDVTITAAFRSDGQQHEVSYVDADGTAQTASAIALDGTETSLAAGWYFVGKDIDYTATITLDGDVNLILADGCTMNIGSNDNRINDYGIDGYIDDSNQFDLTIYGQSLGTGDLNIYTTGDGYHYAVIARNLTINGGNVTAITDDIKATALYVESDLTINGGNVTATSIWSYGNGICCGNSVTINGGIVTANSSNTSITGYGGITINGGIVTANGNTAGIRGYGGITINGGIVTANGSNTGIYAEADDGTALTLGWTRPDDRITVSSISTGEGTVAVKDGQALADESGHIYTGTLTAEHLAAIANQTLTPANLYVINGNSDEPVSFTEQKEHATVIYDRKFTAGVASTIVLPFDFDAKALDGALHTISSIDEQDGKWVATASDAITQGKANTPYLFKPNNDIVSTTFRNVTIVLTEEKAITIGKSKWQMKGVYQFKEWDADSPTDYGFAGAAQQSKEGDEISAGDFVRVGSGAKIRATRCYLTYADGISKASPILPDRITVIFPDATASVIEPQPADPSEDADPSGDITTPISEIAAQSGTKVWGYDGTIYIESQPYTPYTMIDLAGRTLKNGVTNSTREEVTLSRPTGIVIVRIGGKTFKIFNR